MCSSDLDDAVALGLLWWAIGALGGLLGGLVYMLRPEPAAPGKGEPSDESLDAPG